MRVTIVVRILWTAGAQKLAIAEARHLTTLGHEVDLIFLRGSQLGGYDDILRGLNYRVLSPDGKSALTPLYDGITRMFAPEGRGAESRVDLNLIRAFPDSISDAVPDLLICHDQWAGLAGLYAKKRYGVDYSVYIHEKTLPYAVPILGSFADRVEYRVLANARRVFAVTEKVARTIRAKHRVPVVANYIGMDSHPGVPYDQRANRLLAVSMWDSGRRPEVYLSVLAHLPGYELLFVGRWRNAELRTRFLSSARRLGVEDRVHLLEGISEKDLDGAYNSSKFYLRFGWGEYGSGSTAEAIQHSIPLIVNREIGTSEIIESSGAGLVLDQIDPTRIRSYVMDQDVPDRYAALQRNVAQLAADHSWDSHCRLLLT
jgi:glycosyltransferase involved in cell wall biosynthesis